VESLPLDGETVAALDYRTYHGGKGANQAVAACRQDVSVKMIGAVGDDSNGQTYLENLRQEGIDVSGVVKVKEPTGAAFITVDDEGENTIVCATGANSMVGRDAVDRSGEIFSDSAAVLAQFEVPGPTVAEAAVSAELRGVPFILNAAPFFPTYSWTDAPTTYLIVNEREATDLLEFVPSFIDEPMVRQRICELRVENLIITRGSSETWVFTKGGEAFSVETLPVLPIDTVGAGDAFAGCFAARIAMGSSLVDAVRAANCAGALTTLGGGAQSPIPNFDQVEQHIAQISEPIYLSQK
ncbi:MAG: ribokinase, partial [Verrucomicrobiota bacterium]